ncbi:MAG: DinB family protein [Gemmatimonadales bacterium]
MSQYRFLVDTYETERLKVLTLWSTFDDEDLGCRPIPTDSRGRSVVEQMVHQCVSENLWFLNLGIDVAAPPLPDEETRLGFIDRYATDSAARLAQLRDKSDDWWEEVIGFFDTRRTRAWIMVRRIAHTAHHRGQQTILARLSGQALYSTYGPTADTGGLMQHEAPTIYAYDDVDALLAGEKGDRAKPPLPGPGTNPPTERSHSNGVT